MGDQADRCHFFLRASARSRLRRCTLTPKRASTASRHFDVVRPGICRLEFGHEGNHLCSDLVTIPRTAAAGKQSGEAVLLQGVLGLVEGGTGDAKRGGRLADCKAVDLMTPHHLVADLDQVLRIEEGVVGKQLVANKFGIGVEHAVLRQRLALAIRGRCLGHCHPVVCKDKYAALHVVSSANLEYSSKTSC